MNKIIATVLAGAVLASPAFARNDVVSITLQSVLDMPEAKAKLAGVRFYLAGAPSPKVLKKLGTDTGNARTNAFNKTPEEACRWNALSALIKFHEHARRQDANAVIEIVSVRDHVDFKSPTDIECSDGTFSAGITLRGTYANVK
jgi:hypothetical protein